MAEKTCLACHFVPLQFSPKWRETISATGLQSLHAKYYSPKAVRLITDQIADFIQQQCSIKKSDIKAALDIRGQPADTRTAEQKAAIRRLINDLQPK